MHRAPQAPHAGGHDEGFEPHGLQQGALIDNPDLRAPLRTVGTHTGFGQGDDRPTDDPQGRARLRARVAPDTGKAAVALEARLAHAQWPGFAVLLAGADNASPTPQSNHAHDEALVDALLASLDIGAATAGPGMDAQSIQTAAVQAYLRTCGDHPRPPSTLLQIKQLLLSRAALRAHPPAPAESEPMQNRRLLLPLLLLNAFARPRTQGQRQDACDRLDLLQGRTSTACRP